MEAETLTEVFRDNSRLCSKVTETEVQHFVSCIEKSRNVKYLKFLQTVVMGGKSGRRVQEMVMNEVGVVNVCVRLVKIVCRYFCGLVYSCAMHTYTCKIHACS